MLEIIRDVSRLEDMAEAWRELANLNPVPMVSHEWTVAAARAFTEKADLTIFALWEGRLLLAVAPIGLFRFGLTQRLRFLACEIQEPESLLFRDRASLEKLISAVTQHGYALSLSRIPHNGEEEAVLRNRNSSSLTLFGRKSFSHAAILPPSIGLLEESLTKNTRTMLRRKLKHAEKLGPVTFSVETLDEKNWEAFMEDLVRVESSGWKRQNGTSLIDLADQRRFYEFYIKLKTPSKMLRAYRMLILNQVVAIRLGIIAGRKLYEIKIGFDENFRACSPGMILTHETLKAAISEELTAHEFLGAAEDWQKHWPLHINQHISARLYPLTVNGVLNASHDVFDRVQQRVMQFARRR